MTTLGAIARTRATLIWLALVSATVASWWLGTEVGNPAGGSHQTESVVIILMAFVKVRFVGLYFMELRNAPFVLRYLFEAYCLVVCAVVVGMFLTA
ncbi:cytochrome C oxidase subunit IV family protein [Nocardia gamkensis]|uniref:cytochrome C oxidase subunit IV family protein n=1 Tax=Nocardia gamkensis TaxID=352869 RepID=UPI0037CC3B31